MASRFSVKCLSLNFCLVFVHCPSVKFIFLSYNLQTSKSNNNATMQCLALIYDLYYETEKNTDDTEVQSQSDCLKVKILPAKFWVCDKNLGYGELRRLKGKREFVDTSGKQLVCEVSGTWRQIDVMARMSQYILSKKQNNCINNKLSFALSVKLVLLLCWY